MTSSEVGIVGLGNMGSALASNLVDAGYRVLGYDVAGPDRTPSGALAASSIEELAARATIVVLSLPDGAAARQVAQRLLQAAGRRTTHVIDTSTIGVSAARALAELLAGGGIGYIEAPVSGGVSGARARTLTVMCAGPQDAIDAAAPVLSALSDRVHRIPGPPGSAQALKLANNFLSATALAATSEAIAFGQSAGLDMKTMLEVLNASSGRSAATMDKFPEQVLTGRYASGFANSLMAKDLRLYLAAVAEAGAPASLGTLTTDIWERFAERAPGADFTCIFPFVSDG